MMAQNKAPYFASGQDTAEMAYDRGWDDMARGHFSQLYKKEKLALSYVAGYRARAFQDMGEQQWLI